MKPSVKFGLIGGVVYALILIIGTYYLEQSTRNLTVVVYLKLLVLTVSVIATIKGVRDLDRRAPFELKAGLKAGLSTVLIICAFIFCFGVIYPQTITEEDFNATNDIGFNEYFKRLPVTDTTQAAFEREMKEYETAKKANDIFSANLSLRKAKIIHPSDNSLDGLIKENNHLLFLKYKDIGFTIKSVFLRDVFTQIVMGFLVSFATCMIFKSRNQAGL